MDFNGELTPEQVREVEKLANQAVWDNIPVEILYPTKEELASMDYRSKIEIEGQVRIVRIGDVDMCALSLIHIWWFELQLLDLVRMVRTTSV